MRHNNWTHIVVLTSTNRIHFQGGLGLTKQLQAAEMRVLKPAAFEPGSFPSTPSQLGEIRRSGIQMCETTLNKLRTFIVVGPSQMQFFC